MTDFDLDSMYDDDVYDTILPHMWHFTRYPLTHDHPIYTLSTSGHPHRTLTARNTPLLPTSDPFCDTFRIMYIPLSVHRVFRTSASIALS